MSRCLELLRPGLPQQGSLYSYTVSTIKPFLPYIACFCRIFGHSGENARTCRKLGHISVASQQSGSVTEEGQENHNVTVTPRRKCDTKPGQREYFTRLTQSYRLRRY